MSLEQGRMSATAYEAKFHALSKYATQLCFSPQEQICRFVKGLRSELWISALQVAAMAKSFQEVVDFVVEVEGVKQTNSPWHRHQRGFEREVSLMVLTLEYKVSEVTQSYQFSLHYRL